MKAVKRTTIPTIKQMQNMASNLEEKFNNASTIDISIWSSKSIKPYQLYVAYTHNLNFTSWKSLQDKYFEIMEDVDA